jgi:hypothetical protein
VRIREGRGGEIVELVRQLVGENPGLDLFAVMLAELYCDLDRFEDARAILDRFVTDAFDSVRYDQIWLVVMCTAASSVAELKWVEAAEVLFDRLRPFADQIPYSGPICLSSVSYYVARLAETLGDAAVAESYFAKSTATHERIGAAWSSATDQLAWGRFIADRDDESDFPRAQKLLDQALTSARARGYGLVERRAVKALEGLRWRRGTRKGVTSNMQ